MGLTQGPDKAFWGERFLRGETPWDRGDVSPQLLQWLDSGELRPCHVLVPGCGTGHEVVELARCGFNVTGVDYAPAALGIASDRLAQNELKATLVEADLLSWETTQPFDAIYEQTSLCALYPDVWVAYANKIQQWLRPGGQLFALFAQIHRPRGAQGFIEGPPYHCDVNAMRSLFPEPQWHWPKPPYLCIEHPVLRGFQELAVKLERY